VNKLDRKNIVKISYSIPMNRNKASLLCKSIGLCLLDLYSRCLARNLYGDKDTAVLKNSLQLPAAACNRLTTTLIFLLTFGILPPQILVCYPVVLSIIGYFGWDDTNTVHTLRRWIPLYKFVPVFDAFWSEFKPNCKVFAGFYFVYVSSPSTSLALLLPMFTKYIFGCLFFLWLCYFCMP